MLTALENGVKGGKWPGTRNGAREREKTWEIINAGPIPFLLSKGF